MLNTPNGPISAVQEFTWALMEADIMLELATLEEKWNVSTILDLVWQIGVCHEENTSPHFSGGEFAADLAIVCSDLAKLFMCQNDDFLLALQSSASTALDSRGAWLISRHF